MFGRALIAALVLLTPGRVDAFCMYHGVDNAKTTLEQEFRDSRWVVRAHVVSADYHWADVGESWTLYRLRVVQNFKGKLPSRFTFFTERDSGGFYMDGDDATPKLGDYLLFLTPLHHSGDPPAARKAVSVNYNCGQSKPWERVTKDELKRLRRVSSR